MKCPNCGKRVNVLDSRERDGAIKRLRECSSCFFRFETEERFVRRVSWWDCSGSVNHCLRKDGEQE